MKNETEEQKQEHYLSKKTDLTYIVVADVLKHRIPLFQSWCFSSYDMVWLWFSQI